MESISKEKFCGQAVTDQQLNEIRDTIDIFPKLSRTELANTICELYSWRRPNGKLKTVECREFLERLDEKGKVTLPSCRKQFASSNLSRIQRTENTDARPVLTAGLQDLSPIELVKIENREQRNLWYEYVDRYHYLGYLLPFGAQLRYFIKSGATGDILGCFQFSSPAWKMACRDRWIGWSDTERKSNLQKIINNSRYLIFPWVRVKNLASTALALAVKKVPDDWQNSYGYRPVLLETLIDRARFKGTCYKAANWLHLGETTGRGRMDREHKRQGSAVKDIYVYPLMPEYRRKLAGV